MLKKILLLAVLALVGPTLAQADADNWEQTRESDGITVWTREVPGSPLRAFKATMTVRSTLAGLVNLIQDTDNAGRWVYSTRRILMLKRDVEQGSFVIRVETDFPWPLADRDVVVAGQVVQEAKTGTVTINSRAVNGAEHPPQPGFVRMPEMDGTWIFRPLGGGNVEVTMIGRADPAGHIPPGLINLLIDVTPYKTMQGMRRMLKEPRYQNTLLPQIREPGQAP